MALHVRYASLTLLLNLCCSGAVLGASSGAAAFGEAVVAHDISKAVTELQGLKAEGNASALSVAIIDALAADAASLQSGLGDLDAFAKSMAEAMSQALVPQSTQISALGRALAEVLVECSSANSCNTGSTTSFAGVTQAGLILNIAVAAGLRGKLTEVFTEAKQVGVPVVQLTKSTFLFASPDVAAAVAAINEVFGATLPALNKAGNASQVAQLLLASAEAAVALGQPSVYGADNIANKTNDITGAATLAAALRESKLAPSIIDDALSAAIAKGLNESTEATAVLVASAVMTDNSTAVTTTAEGIKQAVAAGEPITTGLAPLCQAQFASEDLGFTYGNVTQDAILAALGNSSTAALKNTYACRRYPGVVG